MRSSKKQEPLLRTLEELLIEEKLQHDKLLEAIRVKDNSVALDLIQSGVALDVKNMFGSTALHEACLKRMEPVAIAMIQHGAPLDATDMGGETPLHAACSRKLEKAAEHMLDRGASVNTENQQGDTALFYASLTEMSDTVAAMINAGAKPLSMGQLSSLSSDQKESLAGIAHSLAKQNIPLKHLVTSEITNDFYLACMMGWEDAAIAIIEQKGIPTRLNDTQNALHCACSKGLHSVASLLLDTKKGPSLLKQKNIFGETPLHIACSKGLSDIALKMIEMGAPLDAVDKTGNTPLHRACERNLGHVAKRMLENGANPMISNLEGDTALSISKRLEIPEVAEHIDRRFTHGAIDECAPCNVLEIVDASLQPLSVESIDQQR